MQGAPVPFAESLTFFFSYSLINDTVIEVGMGINYQDKDQYNNRTIDNTHEHTLTCLAELC